jgi:hypothetical protein
MASLEVQLQNIIRPLTKELVNAAVRWTQENIKRQKWEGSAWPKRKKETKLSKGKPLLTGRRDLYNAFQIVDDHSFGVVGARIHNYGGAVAHPALTHRLTFKSYKRGRFAGKALFHRNNDKASFSKTAQSGAYNNSIPQR